MNASKMAKSAGTFITLADVVKKGFNPLAYRLFVLGAHYRTQLSFTWDALRGSAEALLRLHRAVAMLKGEAQITRVREANNTNKTYQSYLKRFNETLSDDLNTPRALAILWSTLGDAALAPQEKLKLLLSYDEVLGLGLKDVKKLGLVPPSVLKLAAERELYRARKQFTQADTLRARIGTLGYTVEDTPSGPEVRKK